MTGDFEVLEIGTKRRLEQAEQLAGELAAHVREHITHAELRIADGVELGATVWRIALEDVVRESRALLTRLGLETPATPTAQQKDVA